MRQAVIRRHSGMGSKFNNAYHEDGKGRIWGYLGEEVVIAALGDEITRIDSRDYDIKFKGKSVDVKTKTRKEPPKDFFDAMVLDSARHQKTDVYIFVNIIAPQNLKDNTVDEVLNFKYETGYVLGLITKDNFYKKATFNATGTYSNNFLWREDAWTLPYKELKPFRPGKVYN